jgi:hypothetical protein
VQLLWQLLRWQQGRLLCCCQDVQISFVEILIFADRRSICKIWLDRLRVYSGTSWVTDSLGRYLTVSNRAHRRASRV